MGATGAATRLIPVLLTPGDLLDRITILQIRRTRARSTADQEDCAAVLVRATQAWESAGIDAAPLADLIEALSATNEMLWAEEDRIRECERDGAFGAPFVASARSIVRLNDRRSALKREISARCGSTSAGEVKIYPW